MTTQDRQNIGGDDPTGMFKKGTVAWTRSRDDVWKDLEASLDKAEPPVRTINRSWYLAAAAVILLAGISSFLMLYTKKYSTTPGQTSEVILPDGSGIILSYNSEASYNPFTWRYSRKVRFSGEGFFNVNKGESFTVISSQGRTEVLGTTFNILSTGNIYEVTCFTGKVRVTGANGEDAIITANEKVTFSSNSIPKLEKVEKTEETTGWLKGEFYFTSDPLEYVFAKISRSFGINIEFQPDDELFYTGNFSKENDIEEILEIVCDAFGLRYVKEKDGYRVVE